MLATLIHSVPLYDAAWWLAALWFVRMLCLWSFFWANCPCCPAAGCTHCASGTTPASYQLEASGFSNNGCANCANYNSTFVVPQNGGATSCFFTLINLGICAGDDWDMTITATAITVIIDVDFIADTDLPTFAKTGLTAPFDCSASAEAFPVTFAGDQTLCFHDGSDLIVTSL